MSVQNSRSYTDEQRERMIRNLGDVNRTESENALLRLIDREREAQQSAKEEALRQAAVDWEADYERLTAEVGAFGQTKTRAALILASRLAGRRAEEVRDGKPHHWFGSASE